MKTPYTQLKNIQSPVIMLIKQTHGRNDYYRMRLLSPNGLCEWETFNEPGFGGFIPSCFYHNSKKKTLLNTIEGMWEYDQLNKLSIVEIVTI
jgi:hypothetical protein